MKKVQVGIDLGTTNTLACCRVKGKLKLLKFKGGNMLPSVLYVEQTEDGSIKEIVGKTAKVKGMLDPDNCIQSSKTYIGLTGKNKKTWTCHGKMYTPTDVATKILEEVHKKVRTTYDLEEDDVVQAVITIPAYFSSTQSDETKRAGERAGMEVLRIITEPVAAAISAAEDMEGKIFVVDLGGGTFDVSVLEMGEKYKTLEIGGERKLGGDDFDDRLVNYFLKYIEDDLGIDLSSLETSGLTYEEYYTMMAKIRNEAIEAKVDLSENDEYSVNIPSLFTYGKNQEQYDFMIDITREEFNEICKDLFTRIIDVIDDTVKKSKKFKKQELKAVFLVGGSCYIPKIQEDVEKYFGLSTNFEQDRATQVAMGAGKIADAWTAFTPDQNRVDPFDDKLEDIISHAIGIQILGQHDKKEFSEILAEGAVYPTVCKEIYKTAYDNQESVIIKVYEKTEHEASDFIDRNESAFDFYGSFVLPGLEPAPAGEIPIEVTFDYDQSRTLHATAEEMKNHTKREVVLHKGEVVEDENTVAATDFYLLLDVSGSMSGRKIEEAKEACRKLIQETLDLQAHRLGIITFGDYTNVICELSSDADQLLLSVDRIRLEGSTEMHKAIEEAHRQLESSLRQKAMILITDGWPNYGEATVDAARSARSDGIKIATIGVKGADRDFLKTLSSDQDLNFMVDNIEKLSETFGKAVENLLRK